MKKTLFMCALGLTVATSMVAGTMAIYTHEDDLLSAENATVRAKKFYVGGEMTNYTPDVRLAPGQSADWTFTATNIDPNSNMQSEVLTDLEISIDGGKIKNWDDLQISVTDKDGKTTDCTKAADGKLTVTLPSQFEPETAVTKEYTLTFKWNDTDPKGATEDQAALVIGKEEADLPNVTDFNVTLRGVQSADDKAITR